MTAEDAITRAIAEHNDDLRTRAIIAAAMGSLTILGVFVLSVLVCVIFFGLSHWFIAALFLTGVYVAVGWRAAEKGHQPLGDRAPISDSDALATLATWVATGGLIDTRHGVAAAADILIHGPRCLIEAKQLKEAMLPIDGALIDGAAKTMQRLVTEESVRAEEVHPPSAAVLLWRLGLARPARARDNGVKLVATVKGMESFTPGM